MRDIAHPYLGLGGLPMKNDGAAAPSLPESQARQRIQAEIQLLGIANGPEPDWPAVVDCTVTILRDYGKDMQMAGYLCLGLFKREGYAGLAVGLTIVKDMVLLHWDGLHPPVTDMPSRWDSLNWLAESLAVALKRCRPIPGDGVVLERALAVLADLEHALLGHFGKQAPKFTQVRRQVEGHLNRLPGLMLRSLSSRFWRMLASARRTRLGTGLLVAAACAVLVLIGVGINEYRSYQVRRLDEISNLLLSASERNRDEGVKLLYGLLKTEQYKYLREKEEYLVVNYVQYAERTFGESYSFDAEDVLETGLYLYPENPRLRDARAALRQRAADLRSEFSKRKAELRAAVAQNLPEILPVKESKAAMAQLDRALLLIARGDVRAAREVLDTLAAGMQSDIGVLSYLLPDLMAFAVAELAVGERGPNRFSRSLQYISDGIVFLPENQLLEAVRLRIATARNEDLLRRAVRDFSRLDTALIQMAARDMRNDAPAYHRDLERELAPLLAQRIEQIAKTDPERSQKIGENAFDIFPFYPAFAPYSRIP